MAPGEKTKCGRKRQVCSSKSWKCSEGAPPSAARRRRASGGREAPRHELDITGDGRRPSYRTFNIRKRNESLREFILTKRSLSAQRHNSISEPYPKTPPKLHNLAKKECPRVAGLLLNYSQILKSKSPVISHIRRLRRRVSPVAPCRYPYVISPLAICWIGIPNLFEISNENTPRVKNT